MSEWYGGAELVGLPGMPGTDRGVRKRARSDGWKTASRKGRGGGAEYHISSLPPETKAFLLLRDRRRAGTTQSIVEQVVEAEKPTDVARSEALWQGWERKPAGIRDEAERRLNALHTVEELVREGEPRMSAYQAVADELGESVSTLRSWQRLVKGEHRGDWMPVLAPRWTGRTAFVEYDEKVYQWFRDLYLHPSKPSYAICYRRVVAAAEAEGLQVPSQATLVRRVERQEEPSVVVLEREGERRMLELYPYLQRDRTGFHALEALNGDGHKLDLDVVWPDGERCRATLIAFQDLFSGRIVGWRLAKAESAHEMAIAFLEVCDDYGIPKFLWFDNTRAMASKRMTSGAKGRKRFRDAEGDPLGVLPQLGVTIRFTQVAHGQSKPIERAFRDLAERISKHPAFTGAYLGNNTVNKPANYGARTVTAEEVRRIAEQEILAHNAQPHRTTEVCGGVLSFQEAFERSYATHQARIPRITEAQRRLLYMPAGTTTVRRDGCLEVLKNRYWTQELHRFIGRKMVVRYHPDGLHDRVYAYGLDGAFIAEVPVYAKGGYADADAAERHNRARKQFGRDVKKLAKSRRHLEAAEVAALVPEIPVPERAVATGTDGLLRPAFGVPASPETISLVPTREAQREAAQARITERLAPNAGVLDKLIRERARSSGR